MTPEKLRQILPRASASVIALNADKNENTTHAQIQSSEPQRDAETTLERARQGKEKGVRRTRVRFIGYRVRPLDPDNFAGGCKDLLDGLRHAELIPGDEPWRIIFETEQIRVASFPEEKTIIELS